MNYRFLYILIFISGFISNPVQSQSIDNYFKGLAKYNVGEYEQAINNFSDALNDDIPKQNVYKHIGYAYINLNKIDEAINTFTELSEIDITEGSYGLARCYAIKNDAPAVANQLRIHFNQKDKHSRSSIRTDKYFAQIKETPYWDEIWDIDWYSKYEILYADAYFDYQDKKYNDAIYILDDLISRKPHYHQSYVLRGDVYLAINQPKDALKDYTKAIEIRHKNSDYYYARSKAYEKLKKYDNAIEDIQIAIELNPLNPDLLLQKASLLYDNEDKAQAKQIVNNYLEYFGEDTKAIYLAGKCFYSSDDFKNAIPLFSKAIKVDASNANYFLARGNSYIYTKMYEEALKDFSMALDLNPRLPKVFLSRGVAKIEMGDKDGACEDFNKAYQLGNKDALKLIQENCRE